MRSEDRMWPGLVAVIFVSVTSTATASAQQPFTLWDAQAIPPHRATKSNTLAPPFIDTQLDRSAEEVPATFDVRDVGSPVPTTGGTDAFVAWLYWRARDLEAKGESARAALIFDVIAPHVAHVGGALKAPVAAEPDRGPPAKLRGPALWLRQARDDLEAVHNKAAHDKLARILAQKRLDPALRCEANSLMGLALRRLRKKRDAGPFYRAAAAACTPGVSAAHPGLTKTRIEALYRAALAALSDRSGAAAIAYFEALLAEAPKSRFADDAIYHMIGLARARKHKARAAQLSERLLRDYEASDSARRLVWEPIHAALLTRDWPQAEALLLEAVKLSPDTAIHRQGRSTYYLGLVHQQQGETAAAIASWRACFVANPAAFYGGLALQSLAAADPDVEPWLRSLPRPTEAEPVVFDLRDPEVRGWVRLGDLSRAADAQVRVAQQGPAPNTEALWLAALLAQLAGDATTSHNIARRLVPGFPERYGLPTAQTRLLFEIAYPDPYQHLVDTWSATNEADPFLVRAIMREESGFEPDVVSWAGAVGLMQLMVPTARDNRGAIPRNTISRAALTDPVVNLPIATRLLHRLGTRFDQHPVLVAAAYNAGAGATSKWVKRRNGWQTGLFAEAIPYTQTRNYSRRVVGSYGIYQWLWSEAPPRRWTTTISR